jgi:hypothetical protein
MFLFLKINISPKMVVGFEVFLKCYFVKNDHNIVFKEKRQFCDKNCVPKHQK